MQRAHFLSARFLQLQRGFTFSCSAHVVVATVMTCPYRSQHHPGAKLVSLNPNFMLCSKSPPLGSRQVSGWLGLAHTTRNTLGSKEIHREWMTWECPPELIGRETELLWDMPLIMTSLCNDASLAAFGHNDYTTDNAYFVTDENDNGTSVRLGGVFDWQQSCVNNVGQEWAWNFHWLEPDFLDRHEAELIDLILSTYKSHGRKVDKSAFLEAYVLGTAQMFCWSGGGLQFLLKDLHKQGLFTRLTPGSAVLSGAQQQQPRLDEATREKLTAAEMTRRTFHNCCSIMRRHDFVGVWARWKARH
jgi:hypothetical protein